MNVPDRFVTLSSASAERTAGLGFTSFPSTRAAAACQSSVGGLSSQYAFWYVLV